MFKITKSTKLEDIQSAIDAGHKDFDTDTKLTPQAVEILWRNGCGLYFNGKYSNGFYCDFLWKYANESVKNYWQALGGKQAYCEHKIKAKIFEMKINGI